MSYINLFAFRLLLTLQLVLALLLSLQLMDQMLLILEEITPGSDLHLVYSIKWLARCQAGDGKGTAREVLAQQRVKAALVARYGSHVMDNSEAVAKLVEAVVGRSANLGVGGVHVASMQPGAVHDVWIGYTDYYYCLACELATAKRS